MFRDSRGVVHTVNSADPLEDLPPEAASALSRALLVPVQADLGGALERCEALRELLDRWQDAFFAALPAKVDLEEEARWAAEVGLSLEEIESQWEDEDDDWDEEVPPEPELEEIDLTELAPLDDEPESLLRPEQSPGRRVLGEEVVAELERVLLLLPLRVRLEALVAAGALVDAWTDLLADHEKCLGHLILRHDLRQEALASLDHEVLADQHALLHAESPGHFNKPRKGR